VHDKDDLRDYRHGSAAPSWQPRETPLRRPGPSEEERREQYAEAIARAEFGRFYWNARLADQLAAAMKRPPKPDRKKPR
jgi:hypothetical protein